MVDGRTVGSAARRVMPAAGAAMLAYFLATVPSGAPANAQYPDVEQHQPARGAPDANDPGAPSPPTPAAPATPPAPAAATAKPATVVLTDEEKAEREGRRVCKAAICAAFHNRKAGADVACAVLKSFRKEQLDKLMAKAKASWPWGTVRCAADVTLKREMLVKALTEDKVEATLDKHLVSCTVERGAEPASDIKLEFAPKVTFEKGKAVKAQANWGKLEAPTLVKAALWPATASDNTLNVFGSTLVEDINDFIGNKCEEVRADWEGK